MGINLGNGGGEEGDVNDAVLLKAIRKRLLDEIARRGDAGGGSAERIVNNVYGGGGGGAGGLTEKLYGGAFEPGADDQDYMVDIDREDKLDDEGKRVGWTKRVRRYREKKK